MIGPTELAEHGPTFELLVDSILARHRVAGDRLLIVGICGAQGSGKSTLAEKLCRRLEQTGLRSAVLSLDDLYLSKEKRLRLAADVHPLFATRGPPGTHDLALWSAVFADLQARRPLALPRFDKAADDLCPIEEWPRVDSKVDVLLFEGWCVGASEQGEAALSTPVNELERLRDPDCIWRRHVSKLLGGEYRRLFEHLDMQILLAAPSFDVVAGWRLEQERQLRDRLIEQGRDAGGTMDDATVVRFVAYYQRLTQHILDEMPSRADLVIKLDPERRVLSLEGRSITGNIDRLR